MFGPILLVLFAAVSAQTNIDQPNRARIVYSDCGMPYELVVLSIKYKVGQLFMIADQRYFNEKDLVTLFRCISLKYPEFSSLKVTLFSDRQNLEVAIRSYFKPPPHQNPPEDTSKSDCTNLAAAVLPCPYGYRRATYLRTGSRKGFVEYSPNPSSAAMKEIVVEESKQ
jgi:hypothetical protein